MSRPGRPSRFWVALVVAIVKPISCSWSPKDWRRPRPPAADRRDDHGDQPPVVAGSLLLSHYLYNNGRWPVILAKSGLF